MSDIFSLEMSLINTRGLDDCAHAQLNIKVVGVGDTGSSILEDLIAQGLDDVEFIAMDTDPQALKSSTAPLKLQLGKLMAGTIGCYKVTFGALRQQSNSHKTAILW